MALKNKNRKKDLVFGQVFFDTNNISEIFRWEKFINTLITHSDDRCYITGIITFSGQGEISDRWYSPRANWHNPVRLHQVLQIAQLISTSNSNVGLDKRLHPRGVVFCLLFFRAKP